MKHTHIEKLKQEVVEWKDGKPWTIKELNRDQLKINELVEAHNASLPQSGEEKHHPDALSMSPPVYEIERNTIHDSPSPKEEWEEAFEKEYNDIGFFHLIDELKPKDKIKSFIRNLLSKAVQEERGNQTVVHGEWFKKGVDVERERVEGRIDEYFERLLVITNPQATKESLKEFLSLLK